MIKKTSIIFIAVLLLIGNTFSVFASEEVALIDDEKVAAETVLPQEADLSDKKVSKNATAVIRQTKASSGRAIVQNGTLGTVDWTLDDAGTLTFGGGDFPDNYNWNTLRNLVAASTKTVNFTAPVTAGMHLYAMFENYQELTTITGLDKLDTSNVTNTIGMFANCSNLTNLDVSNLNTSNVEHMSRMFIGCSNLTNLDVSNFDTSNVVSMNSMFDSCSKLTNLDVSNFDTSKVTTSSFMFVNCVGLTNLDVTNFDTSNVLDMSGMFANCSGVTSLDISNFNTGNVTNMAFMFLGAPIRELTLGTTFRFKYNNHGLGAPINDAQYSGNWELVESKAPFTHRELEAFNGINPGTYVWQRAVYNVTYEPNGGTAVTGETVANNSQLTEPVNPTKAGYVFDGWYKEAALTNQWNFVTDLMPANDVTLYAKWKVAEYQITYNLNGGTNSSNNPLTYEFAVGVANFENPTKDGYKFLGWFESDTSNVEITNIGDTEIGDKTLYARWEKIEASVKPGTTTPTAGGKGTVVKYSKTETKTGDEANLLVAGTMLLTSAGYVVTRKRRQNNR